MKSISKEKVVDIITKQTNLKLALKDGYFLQFNKIEITYICYSPNKLEINNPAFLVGLPLISITSGMVTIFPPIVNIICNLEEIQVSNKLATIVTKNESVNIEKDDGDYLIKDMQNRLIAVGSISNHKFKPITDVGFYIREEDIS